MELVGDVDHCCQALVVEVPVQLKSYCGAIILMQVHNFPGRSHSELRKGVVDMSNCEAVLLVSLVEGLGVLAVLCEVPRLTHTGRFLEHHDILRGRVFDPLLDAGDPLLEDQLAVLLLAQSVRLLACAVSSRALFHGVEIFRHASIQSPSYLHYETPALD